MASEYTTNEIKNVEEAEFITLFTDEATDLFRKAQLSILF
jgi:hypothetical protein